MGCGAGVATNCNSYAAPFLYQLTVVDGVHVQCVLFFCGVAQTVRANCALQARWLHAISESKACISQAVAFGVEKV